MWEMIYFFVGLQGAFIFTVLFFGWLLSGLYRKKECERQKELAIQASHAASFKGHSSVSSAKNQSLECMDMIDIHLDPSPKVSVVLPVKGCRPHSLSNWISQLSTNYPAGQLEFIFVVDTEQDEAYLALQELCLNCRSSGMWASVRVHLAGCSKFCSQKIHNLCQGVQQCNPASEYILFLDDDVQLHPGTIGELVKMLECDASLFMATGYPFDMPLRGCGLPAYCALVYHLPLLIPFSVCQRTAFVWGGCVMMRGDSLRTDSHGILKAWQDGGYSDDLTLAAKCSEHKLAVGVPSTAIFPQWLDSKYSWRQYWNYLRRQLYVLDTYANSHNRSVNLLLASLHTWASTSAILPVIAGCCRLCSLLLSGCIWESSLLMTGNSSLLDSQDMTSPPKVTAMASSSQSAALHRPDKLVVESLEYRTFNLSAYAASSPRAAFCDYTLTVMAGDWALLLYFFMGVIAHFGLRFMTCQVLELFRLLKRCGRSNNGQTKSLEEAATRPSRSYPKNLGSKDQAYSEHVSSFYSIDQNSCTEPIAEFNWVKLWVGFFTESVLLPPCLLYSFMHPYVEWGGIRYRKLRGKVKRLETNVGHKGLRSSITVLSGRCENEKRR
ncbi:hypothetical protein CEUSTIGMA_g6966.t1 [Chlamydomonas eustigma]|uniref:ceramide glucosyltransferase n=1 Tax=Chlamydomonas eustigma TaxID=1157962 RepID=A0A250X8X7_9CHLO|nr:hypothetical protein CEUSTIGMA_g6966.t1 [Chlamydomonas eustigma]|eukprot:GAX79525.1 hypothetical protein CEUSTIGMA_g6966.t1 [Chlamydomonas eustigma]